MTQEFTECVAHQTSTDPDCDYCQAHLAQILAQYQAVVEENIELEKRLLAQGAQLNPASALGLRLDTLIAMLFQDPRARATFDLAFIGRYHDMLVEAGHQVTRAKLMAP